MPSTLTIFGIFLSLGSIPLAIKSSGRVSTYRQSQTWPKVQATITQSFVPEGSGDDGTSHLPEFAFRYAVDGAHYSSTLHTEGIPLPGTEDDVQRMLQRYPVGTVVQVAVKPSDPSYAILDTGFPQAWHTVWFASLVAFVVGLAIAVAEMALGK